MKKLLYLLWIIPLFGFGQGKTIAFQKNMKIFDGQASSYYLNTSSTGQTKTGTLDQTITNTGAGGDRGLNLYISHTTNALTGELIGIKASSRINVASASGTVRGGHFAAGNMDAGYALSTATGVFAEVTNKIPSGAIGWTNARGVEINMDINQGTSGNVTTIDNAYMIYGVYNLPTTATYTTVTNGYGMFLRNEQVGGNGQMLDAGFYLDDLNMGGSVKGWDYGIDFSGIGSNSGNFGTADIRFANGATADNTDADTLTVTETVVQVDGILNIIDLKTATTTVLTPTSTGNVDTLETADITETEISYSRGMTYISTSGTQTIGTGGTFERLNEGAIAYTGAHLMDFTHSDGRLTYTGTPTFHATVLVSITIEGDEAAQLVQVRLALNGTTIEGTNRQNDYGATDKDATISFHWLMTLDTNDYLELFGTSDTNADTFEVHNGDLTIIHH